VATENQTLETRVLQVVLSFNPGGTERLVIEIVNRLMAEMPMAVCCLDDLGEWGRELNDRNITATALQRRPGFMPSLARGVARAASRHRATVIHAHQYTPFVYSCLSRWWQKDAAVVFTEHGRLSDAAPSGKRRLANRALGKIPKGIFAVSHDLKQFMVAEGFGSSSVKVIYNGFEVGPLPSVEVRQAVRAELRVSDEVPLVGTIARLDPVKSLDTLLRAVADVARDRPIAVLIVGDGRRSRLEALASELGLQSRSGSWSAATPGAGWPRDVRELVDERRRPLTILEAMAAGFRGGDPGGRHARGGDRRLRDSGALARS
jgi:glycosyltransferase involved in cell wall biosynthesis